MLNQLKTLGAVGPIPFNDALDGDSEGILASGMDRYLTKPLKRAAIGLAITDFCPKDAVPPVSDVPDQAAS